MLVETRLCNWELEPPFHSVVVAAIYSVKAKKEQKLLPSSIPVLKWFCSSSLVRPTLTENEHRQQMFCHFFHDDAYFFLLFFQNQLAHFTVRKLMQKSRGKINGFFNPNSKLNHLIWIFMLSFSLFLLIG